MAFLDPAGNNLTKAELTALLTAQSTETVYTSNGQVFQSFTQPGGKFERSQRLLLDAGGRITQSDLDALFTAATITAITPATGPAAGGTNVTITGKNFSGAEGATFGGTAATNFKVVSDSVITCTTPAKTAGTYNLVVVDDSGNVTKTNAFVYS